MYWLFGRSIRATLDWKATRTACIFATFVKTVLLVEDDSDDAFVMKMACHRSGIPHHLKLAEDGDVAVKYLSGDGKFKDRTAFPFPDVVFLDIKMPKRDGHEVLKWIRDQPDLKNLPVVMLTGSLQPADIDRAFDLGVTSYLKKVPCPAEFGQAVRIILKYWLDLHVAPH
jgi:CheY-like chemotaxis protein